MLHHLCNINTAYFNGVNKHIILKLIVMAPIFNYVCYNENG